MTLKEARKLMEKDGEKYTDEELEKSIETMQILANVIIDSFLKLTPKERAKYKDPNYEGVK